DRHLALRGGAARARVDVPRAADARGLRGMAQDPRRHRIDVRGPGIERAGVAHRCGAGGGRSRELEVGALAGMDGMEILTARRVDALEDAAPYRDDTARLRALA